MIDIDAFLAKGDGLSEIDRLEREFGECWERIMAIKRRLYELEKAAKAQDAVRERLRLDIDRVLTPATRVGSSTEVSGARPLRKIINGEKA